LDLSRGGHNACKHHLFLCLVLQIAALDMV
jgi:hypothetical protein